MSKIKSKYATVDIRHDSGASKVERRVRAGERVPVTVHGYIDQPGRADAESLEFYITVTSLEVG